MKLLLALVLTVMPSVNLDGNALKQVSRVDRLARSLHIGTRLDNWTVVVIPLGEFQRVCPYEPDKFEVCSDPKTNVTHINADWLAWGVTDKKLRHVLAHEAGHLISKSADEDVADATGATL
jgi:hypothetical protein